MPLRRPWTVTRPAISMLGFRSKVTSESIRYVRPGPNSGTMILSLLAQADAFSYEIRWCIPKADGTPGEFSSRPVATVRPATLITDLVPGAYYMFQVRTVTKEGHTDWGQPITRMCT